jgi:hypothetical protein
MAAAVPAVNLATMAMEPGLRFLLQERSVPILLQEKLVEEGILTISDFVNLDRSKDAIRDMIRDEWGITGPNSRSGVAKFLAAWTSAGVKIAKEDEEAATSRASRLPRTLPVGEHLLLRNEFKEHWGALSDADCPSNSLVELRLNLLEGGEQRAEPFQKLRSGPTARNSASPAISPQEATSRSPTSPSIHSCRVILRNFVIASWSGGPPGYSPPFALPLAPP